MLIIRDVYFTELSITAQKIMVCLSHISENQIAVMHFIFQLNMYLNIAWAWLLSNTRFIKASCEAIIEHAKNGFWE